MFDVESVCSLSSGTFVLVEDGDGRSSICSVPQPHRPVGGAGQQSVMSRAVDQSPHCICVSAQRPPQHRRLYYSQRERVRHTFTPTHTRSVWTAAYRTSHRGRCSGSECSSSEWIRPNLRWNTGLHWSSSPHTEPDPCGPEQDNVQMLTLIWSFNPCVVFIWEVTLRVFGDPRQQNVIL